MQIISGFLKGRKIDGYDIDGTRPTMDRVRESLFSMINLYIKDSVCLDLFAGSGVLGIEAISEGASLCYFNDKNKKCVDLINDNISKFNIKEYSSVFNMDYMNFLNYIKDKNIKFDIVFLDPPYKEECLNEVINYILNNNLLSDKGLIVIEINHNYLEEYSDLSLIKERTYGDKLILIYQKN